MPALAIENPGVPLVSSFNVLLDELLNEAAEAKPAPTIEPCLKKSSFNDIGGRISNCLSSYATTGRGRTADQSTGSRDAAKSQQFAFIETAARHLFGQLIASTPIESPDFVKMWNFLDILSILSDDGQCDPALLFWLVEELLDSQTISGCRKVFDYLESRREQITGKHFKQRQLVILRSCNELLRRLSRAEDTAFCGRVFIFMFQCFPLGDRSSVNLRGEYHAENVTVYEEPIEENELPTDSKMDVDPPADTSTPAAVDTKGTDKGANSNLKEPQKLYDPDTLYPLFWSLQESFSQPLKLFDSAHFIKFKSSLDATMKAFQAVYKNESTSRSLENSKRSLKRKRGDEELGDGTETFNPKYLTSRDLFELEISDVSFRRHVLVQALIVTDFLLSLTTEAKEKHATMNAPNRAVVYNDQLSEEDAKWALETKSTISDYLKKGTDGPYFYRMVETVLARDKNWVFWKMASCPPIQREPVSAAIFIEARAAAQRSATSKRLRPTPMGSLSLDFLKDGDDSVLLHQLKSSERYQLPELDSFRRKIADDEFEIGMPTNEQTKAAAIAGISSKSWRALRIAARSKLSAFDKIEDPKKVDIIFHELDESNQAEEDTDEVAAVAAEVEMPSDRSPIIISGPRAVGKSAVISRLCEQHKGVFVRVVRHTTREPLDGEINGKTFHFVSTQEFNQLRDGDRLVEYGDRDGTTYGTSSKVIDAIQESGKVPIMELDLEAAQFAKDMAFPARYILIKPPPSPETYKQRLSSTGLDSPAVQRIMDQIPSDLDPSKTTQLFDHSPSNVGDVDTVSGALSAFIYSRPITKVNKSTADANGAPVQDGEANQQQHSQTDGAKGVDGDVVMG
ncbi:related to nuclear matrix protein p84 [Claviceps purpurea 20.1]|uniref:Related to nuclear matrix protein p84 n=1 Tax=Claviceps purpurea (strain 20.1) TaxID=1111077 RepID=M1WH00_CLAP2|nr:hypothetical protein E4U27_000061 [Claviceps purpurea]CCE32249.1 related to nuclear matrix protein p84 [Claviceps purpurea 20.1]